MSDFVPLDSITLRSGNHDNRAEGVCLMEAMSKMKQRLFVLVQNAVLAHMNENLSNKREGWGCPMCDGEGPHAFTLHTADCPYTPFLEGLGHTQEGASAP